MVISSLTFYNEDSSLEGGANKQAITDSKFEYNRIYFGNSIKRIGKMFIKQYFERNNKLDVDNKYFNKFIPFIKKDKKPNDINIEMQ